MKYIYLISALTFWILLGVSLRHIPKEDTVTIKVVQYYSIFEINVTERYYEWIIQHEEEYNPLCFNGGHFFECGYASDMPYKIIYVHNNREILRFWVWITICAIFIFIFSISFVKELAPLNKNA